MTDEPRYPDSAVREILRGSRKAELPISTAGGDRGFTLTELESIAREAGLDDAGIPLAAADLSLRRTRGPLGGASRARIARSIPGVVRERDFGRLADAIADAAGETGLRERTLGGLQWRDSRGAARLEVRVTPEEATTALRVQADASALKGLCYLGSIAGALALGGITGAILEPSGILAGVGIMAGAAAAGAGTGWAAWRFQARRIRARVARVFAATSARVAELADRGEPA